MFKIVGIGLLFLASAIFGLFKAEELKRRLEILRDFHQLLTRITGEIGYFKEPLPEIFQRLITQGTPLSQTLLSRCMAAYDCQQKDMKEIWDRTIKEMFGMEPLTTEDLRLFQLGGTFLGQSNYETQIMQFHLLEEQLKEQIYQAENDVKTKGRLYSKAGFSVGAVLAVALI